MNNHPLTKLFTSLWLTVGLLLFSLVIIFLGTMAQEPMGLNIAVDRFFKSWLVDSVAFKAACIKTLELLGVQMAPVTPDEVLQEYGFLGVFPGGYLVGTLLLINLVAAYIQRFKWSAQKAGVYMSHIGIITLLLGQIITDVLQVESFVHLERGDRRNYSVSFDDNELIFMLPLEGGTSNRVVSIPEGILKKDSVIKHPELEDLEIKVIRHWANAKPLTAEQLVKLDQEEQGKSQKQVVDQTFEVMNTRITSMEEYLKNNPNAEHRSNLTRVKGRFFEAQSQNIELRELADVLGLVGEMEMQVYGLKEDDKKIVFNDASVRGLIIKIRSFENQQTIAGLFNNATQGMLRGCKLAEFDSNATDFAQKIKDFPGGAGGKIEENTGKFVKRIRSKAKLYYADTTKGRLGDHFRFMQPLQIGLSQNDRNLPAVVFEVIHKGKWIGTYLASCSSEFVQTVEAGDHSWKMILRPKRHYMDFDLTLVDLKWEKYSGTEIPKNFQSRMVVEDSEESRLVDVKMNEPLRKNGQTFYQYQMNENQIGETVQTVLQVVRNPNWITAYVGCVIVSLGLLYQFLYHLLGFSRKRRQKAEA